MAIGLNADTDYANVTGLAQGDLGADGFHDYAICGWYYRASSGATKTEIADGAIIFLDAQASARDMRLGFNNRFNDGSINDPYLVLQGNSGAIDVTFAAGEQPPFDEWIGWYLKDTTDTTEAGWRTLDDATWYTVNALNETATSQYIADVWIGHVPTNIAYGHYAYVRAIDAAKTQSEINTLLESDAVDAGDFAFWPLADNTDTGDDAGSSTLTFNSVTSETSPTLGSSAQADLTLGDKFAALQTSLSGVSWAWFDEDVGAMNAPTAQGAVETTDDSGFMSIDLTGTALTNGQTGTLVLYDSTGAKYGAYRAIVGTNATKFRFDSPVSGSSFYFDEQSEYVGFILQPPMGPWR